MSEYVGLKYHDTRHLPSNGPKVGETYLLSIYLYLSTDFLFINHLLSIIYQSSIIYLLSIFYLSITHHLPTFLSRKQGKSPHTWKNGSTCVQVICFIVFITRLEL
jgi:hypothetical protein